MTRVLNLLKFKGKTKNFLLIGIFPHKADRSLKCIKLQEKYEDKEEKHIGNLIRKSPKIKGAC